MKLLVLGLIAIIVVGYTAFTMMNPGRINLLAGAQKIETTEAEPMRQAKKLYEAKKATNPDFTKGECLSEDVGNGWAVDIVHNPRTVDDEQNKCTSFETGKVMHLIEMTPDGKIVRAE